MSYENNYHMTPINTGIQSANDEKDTNIEYMNADDAGEHEYQDLTNRTCADNYDILKSSVVNDLHKSGSDHNKRQLASGSQYAYAYSINNPESEYDYVEQTEHARDKITVQCEAKQKNRDSLYHDYLELKPTGGDIDVSASCGTKRCKIISVCVVISVLVMASIFICVFILRGQGKSDSQNTEQRNITANYNSTSMETTTKQPFQTSHQSTRTTTEAIKTAQTTPTRGESKKNVALHKRARQSSTYHVGIAERAVDGNKNSSYKASNTCTHTGMDYNAWWVVDLGVPFRILSVVITNRQDCCGARINGVAVQGGINGFDMHVCGETTADFTNVETIRIRCRKPIKARFVRVYVPGRKTLLTLCEVEVYGTEI